MTTRSEFLNRIRSGLDRPAGRMPAVGPAPDVPERLVRLTWPTEQLAALFAARAAATGMVIHRCTPDNLAHTVRALLGSLDASSVILDHFDPTLARIVAGSLAASATNVIDPRHSQSLDPQFDSSAGITGVLAAIAETGTLVVVSADDRSRGTFMIPPVHITIVRESQIIPDMIDLWPLIGSSPPTALTLITGPSKTADIEGILVTGVHGPKSVHIILIASGPVDSLSHSSSSHHAHGDTP